MNVIIAGETTVEKYSVFSNMHFYGETEGENDRCTDRYALAYPSFGFNKKPLHPESASSIPIAKLKSEGSWYGQAQWDTITFHGFK